MNARRTIVAGIAVVLLLAAAAPALAQTQGTGPVSGWAAGVCNGAGTVADKVADLLGLSSEDIAEARQEGKSLAEIAEGQGVTQDELVQAIMEGRTELLDQAVAAGRITQEQADLMLQQMEERIRERTSEESFGPYGGGRGGFGGGPGGCGGPGAGPGLGGGLGGGCGAQTGAAGTVL
ncbi:MAG: hypothetical protein Kow00129_03680 [Thermoleophilia bacterium]